MSNGASNSGPPSLQSYVAAADRVSETARTADRANLDATAWLAVSAHMGVALSQLDDESAEISRQLGMSSAQARLLEYLKSQVGELVDRRALRGVAQIDDWARRIRELRVEHGWPITSSAQDERIPNGKYRLDSLHPDAKLANKWKVANKIRKQSGSGFDRGLTYLKEIYPEPAAADELFYVMKIKSYARRIREMAEHGWMIDSNVDDSSLPPGTYRLTTLTQAPARVREAIKLRYSVFERDRFTCQDCGRKPVDGITLQAHHKLMVSQGGDNSESNLVTLCPDCHAGRHSLSKGNTQDELLNPGSEQFRISR